MTFTSFNRRLELRCGSLGNVFFREESIFGRMWRFFSSKLKMNIYWILAFLPQPWDYKDPWLNFQVGASDEKLGDNIQTWLRKLEEGSRLPLPEKCPSLVRLTWIVKWSEVKCYSILSFRITFSSKSSFLSFLVQVYTDLMLPCWNLEPKERPSFMELRMRLDKIELQVTWRK